MGPPPRYTAAMTTSRAPSILAIVGAVVLIASAVLVARAFVAQGAVRTLTGVVTWVDTAQAQFDRDVHRELAFPSPSPQPECAEAMLAVSLAPGQSVDVYDGSGAIIARGSLGPALAPVSNGSSSGDQECAVTFKVPAIPRTTDYVVEVGRHRASYASYDLDSADWDIQLPLASR